ncbi:AraC family transcriptional regulator [Luteolibacter sp. LG18]|uniref:helix-turn-helix transcriptional regulator n=1 Tax=Luteolibacter sp. LG18 TaxID=2819286 RepID=UPI002B286263|nr:hypothetical protein llg_06020 [Luteolibacter sp. LG18]
MAKTPPPAARLPALDAFFASVALPDLLRPFDSVPGLLYIVKDHLSRVMAISPESVARMGYRHEDEVLGKLPHEYLPPELARKFCADDQWVIRHGEPRLNLVEMWFSPAGKRDWIVTDKYPLRDRDGQVVGVIGIHQNLDLRRKRLAHLGPAGEAADYIRKRLGEPLMVGEIARHVGFSERQLQRVFRQVFGQTIQQYIIENRLHAATDALVNSGQEISAIALALGFHDQSAFANRFKRFTGRSPRAYRMEALRQ